MKYLTNSDSRLVKAVNCKDTAIWLPKCSCNKLLAEMTMNHRDCCRQCRKEMDYFAFEPKYFV